MKSANALHTEAPYRLAVGQVTSLSSPACVSRWLSAELIASAPQGMRRPVWLAGRVLLAQLLDNGMLPLLRSGSHGKPWHPELPAFNITNSAHAVAVLVGCHPVGCDMELLRPRKRWQAVAQHSFAAPLYEQLLELPEEEQLAEFWRFWTAHEAVVKQRGGTVWQLPELNLPLASLCPPGLHLMHIVCGEMLIACCGHQVFAPNFAPGQVVGRV